MKEISLADGRASTPFKIWGFRGIKKGEIIGTNSPDGHARTMENPERVPPSLKLRINDSTFEFDEDDIAMIKEAITDCENHE